MDISQALFRGQRHTIDYLLEIFQGPEASKTDSTFQDLLMAKLPRNLRGDLSARPETPEI
jgi:hypothetical protein